MKETEKKSPKELWQKAVKTVLTSIHEKGFHPADAVRVHLKEQDAYQQELSQGIQIRGNVKYRVLKMTPEQLEAHRLTYQNGELRQADGMVADTSEQESKGEHGIQAFVMSKQGGLYIGTHKNLLEQDTETLMHGSFLSDRPAEMAGIIGIKNGKITMIGNNSGHYQPDELDMYRGIKHLEKIIPEAFAENCQVQIVSDGYLNPLPLASFMTKMEAIGSDGIPRHENLRNTRIAAMAKDLESYKALGANSKDLHGSSPLSRAMNSDVIDVALVKTLIDKLDAQEMKDHSHVLLKAIKGENSEVTKLLIDRLDAEEINELDFTLHFAASRGNTEIAKLLIDKGAKLDTRGTMGTTPLHIAVDKGNTEIAKLLIGAGADLNIKDLGANTTPLDRAMYQGNAAIVNLLIDAGADFDIKICDEKKYLHRAIRREFNDLAELLIKKGTNLTILDCYESPMKLAVDVGNTKLVKLLIDNGVDISNSLYKAIEKNYTDLAELLIEKGASPNSQSGGEYGRQWIPLHNAVSAGNIKVVEALIAKGANLNIKDISGATALHHACDNLSVVKLLIDKGEKIDIQDHSGATALHYTSDIDVAKALIAKGANLNIKDTSGATALHYASEDNKIEIYGALIKAGADPDIKNNQGNVANILNPDQVKYMSDLLSASAKGNDVKAAINILMSFPADKRVDLAKDTIQTLSKNNNLKEIEILISAFPDNKKELVIWSEASIAAKGLAHAKQSQEKYHIDGKRLSHSLASSTLLRQ